MEKMLIFDIKCKKTQLNYVFSSDFLVFMHENDTYLLYLPHIYYKITTNQSKMEKDIHWIKVEPVDQKRNNEWLAEQLRKYSATISSQVT